MKGRTGFVGKNKHDIEILKEIHKNAAMCVDALNLLEPTVSREEIKNSIREQIGTLSGIEKHARQQIEARGEVPRPAETRLGLWISTRGQGTDNEFAGSLARMLVEGNTDGITDLTNALESCPQADESLKETARKLLDAEQKSIDTISSFM